MERLFIPTNLNGFIKVKLTDTGKEIYNQQFDLLNVYLGSKVLTPRTLEVDNEGYTQFQIHEFMNIFGVYLTSVNMSLPCEPNILVQIKPF